VTLSAYAKAYGSVVTTSIFPLPLRERGGYTPEIKKKKKFHT